MNKPHSAKLLVTLAALAVILLSMPVQAGQGREPAAEPRDLTYFYAYLEDARHEPAGPIYEFLKDKPFIRDWLAKQRAADHKFRPMLQWRHWANQPQRFLPSFLFCLLVTALLWTAFPSSLAGAAASCRSRFWKSFLAGVAVSFIWLLFTKSVFLTHVGWPLGIMLTGAFQLALLGGLAVAVAIIGESLARLTRLNAVAALKVRPLALRLICYTLGSLVCALVILIPGPGDLPRVGTRVLALFAILGMGGLTRHYIDLVHGPSAGWLK